MYFFAWKMLVICHVHDLLVFLSKETTILNLIMKMKQKLKWILWAHLEKVLELRKSSAGAGFLRCDRPCLSTNAWWETGIRQADGTKILLSLFISHVDLVNRAELCAKEHRKYKKNSR